MVKTRQPGDLLKAFQAKKQKASSTLAPINRGRKAQEAYANKFGVVPQVSTQTRTKRKASKLDMKMAFKKKRKSAKKKALA